MAMMVMTVTTTTVMIIALTDDNFLRISVATRGEGGELKLGLCMYSTLAVQRWGNARTDPRENPCGVVWDRCKGFLTLYRY